MPFSLNQQQLNDIRCLGIRWFSPTVKNYLRQVRNYLQSLENFSSDWFETTSGVGGKLSLIVGNPPPIIRILPLIIRILPPIIRILPPIIRTLPPIISTLPPRVITVPPIISKLCVNQTNKSNNLLKYQEIKSEKYFLVLYFIFYVFSLSYKLQGTFMIDSLSFALSSPFFYIFASSNSLKHTTRLLSLVSKYTHLNI